MKKFIFGVCLLFLSTSFSETRRTQVYDIGKSKEAPKFTQETEITAGEGNMKNWNSKITDPSGKVVMTEKAKLKDGKIIYQYIEQLQVNEAYELNVENGKATFKTYKIVDGKAGPATETKTHDIDDRFMTGPMTEPVIQKNWAELMAGKVLKVEFGIFELSKLVSFEFKKIKEDAKTIQFEMKASNFFISALLDPIQIEFDKERKTMTRFVGRIPLQQKVETRWKAVDAEIIYSPTML